MAMAKPWAELSKMHDEVGLFVEGLAQARQGTEWFHINSDGTPAYTQRYDLVGPFSGGLARARKDGVWFNIRPDGTRVE